MKSLFTFLILLAAGFAAGYVAARGRTLELISSKMHPPAPPRVEAEFRPNPYPLEDRPFTLVIVGRNNGAYVEKTLKSVFSQKYENFKIVYVDDASDDGSSEVAKELIYDSSRLPQTEILQNAKPLGYLASLSQVVRGLADEEIVVILNGEDWLAHEWVLAHLNEYYDDPDLWLTYGQSSDYPTYEIGHARPLLDKPIRSQPFAKAHLETFYAHLFKKIREEDFQYKGEYFQGNVDLAYMLPMLEMGKGHSQCLSEVLYICNRGRSPENREIQAVVEKQIRSMRPYDP
jgi:glycosyltransferase involved in cell wall biosynthesis